MGYLTSKRGKADGNLELGIPIYLDWGVEGITDALYPPI